MKGVKKMKKVFTIITLLTLWQSCIIAQTAIAPEDGDGTEANPYQIATWQNLYWLSENSAMWSKHYIQTANIDLGSATPAISTWDSNQGLKTIGNSGTKFTGSYNGQEFTISGLYINRSSSYLGLFGYTEGATINNLGLISITVQGDGIQFAGGLAGYTTLSSVVKNCHSSGTITITNNDNKKGYGGLIGWASSSLIEDCYSECDVNAGEATGGFVGNVSNWTTINNCYCSGNVTGNFKTGGFVGINFSSNCKIIQCYSEANVTGGEYTAGFAGQNCGLIKESYCTGSVTEALSDKAGFVAWNDTPGQITDCYSRSTVGPPSGSIGNASGFVYSNKGTITDSYNTGQLTGTNRYGFANKNTGTITDCFWDSETTLSNNNGAGGTPKTTAEMKTKSTFTGAGWDFDDTWNILVGINDDYPGFQWNPALMRLVIVTSGASQMIKLPLKGIVNCTVDWGDGTAPEDFTTSGDKPHTYSVADTFQVTIYGSLTWFGTSGSAWTGVKYLKDVLSFGELGLTSLMGAFFDPDSLKSVPALLPASITNLAATFGNIYPDTIANLSLWDVSNVTNMLSMFDFATNFNQDIGNWDVGKVTNMKSMFYRAYAFNQDIGGWDVAKVTDMSGMFSQAYAFNQDIGGWDVSQVTTLGLMYFQASNFNQNIGNWNVGIVTDFYAMFAGALLFNQDIGDWDVAGATDMGNMFTGASAFNQDVSGWAIEGVTNMDNMFNAATAFNQNLGSWTLNSGVTLTDFLKNCGMDCENYSLILSGWADNTNTPSGRSMGATGRTYGTDAATARTTLVSTKGWTITGDIAGTVACMCTNPDDGGTIAEA